MPVQFRNPLLNCDHIKEESFLESKSTKKKNEKIMLIRQMYLVTMVTFQLKYSEKSFLPLCHCFLWSWLVDYQLVEP